MCAWSELLCIVSVSEIHARFKERRKKGRKKRRGEGGRKEERRKKEKRERREKGRKEREKGKGKKQGRKEEERKKRKKEKVKILYMKNTRIPSLKVFAYIL